MLQRSSPLPIGTRTSQLGLHESLRIYDAFGDSVEHLIRFRFLIQRTLQKLSGLILAEQMGKSANTAVTGDLVVFDFLRGNNDAGVNYGFITILLQNFRSLLN